MHEYLRPNVKDGGFSSQSMQGKPTITCIHSCTGLKDERGHVLAEKTELRLRCFRYCLGMSLQMIKG